jgi:hypothetical protein
MIRTRPPPLSLDGGRDTAADDTTQVDSARIALGIGVTALDLARQASAAGLTTLAFLLENVALEAGTQAEARQWPSDARDD